MPKTLTITLLLGIIIVLGSAALWTQGTPKIVVTPEVALIDEPVEIAIHNLKAHEQVTVEAACPYGIDHAWKSWALFKADDKGVVNVAQQAPISGSYSGIDRMGLFWSMAPENTEILKKQEILNIYKVSLKVLVDGKVCAQRTIERLAVAPNVEKRVIKKEGVVGTLFYPQGAQHLPGVIVLGGSGGRIQEDLAQLFASHGYAALALGYFGVEGLPPRLHNISLEYFHNAMQWFKKQEQVDARRIALCGRSRGGELVLLLGATFPQEMQALIAYVPGCIVGSDSWTYNNKSIPGLQTPSEEQERQAIQKGLIPTHAGTFDDPEESTPIYRWIVKSANSQEIEAATIPVEKIECPLLLISAEDDKMWQSTDFSNMVMDRLDEHRSVIKRKHLHFPGAGHGVQNPYGAANGGYPYYHPRAQRWMAVGGTLLGNARANEQAWQEALEFLRTALGT